MFLVRRCPEVAKTKDVDGWLPLHFACQFTAPLEVIQFLVEQWPEAVKKTNDFGWLPLHVACYYNASLEVVQYLMHQYPEAVKKTTVNGYLPLDFAKSSVGRNPIPEVIALLQDVDAGSKFPRNKRLRQRQASQSPNQT
jgi:ankyrin repeat protein